MFDVTKIQAALNGLVGFRQPVNPAFAILDAPNQVSRSGRFITDNPFVKIELIKDSQDYQAISNTEFNTLLANKQNDSIANVCDRVFNKPDFIDRGLYYQYAYNKKNTVTLPATSFVGYRIDVSVKQNIGIKITRVLLDFANVGDSITIVLFNTAQIAPLQTKAVTVTTDHQEEQLNWVLDNTSGIHKGDYYIGILTDGLTLTPYKRDYDNSSVEREYTHLDISRIKFTGHNTLTLPNDLETQEGNDDYNGLNFDITVYDDFTDQIINNEQIFATAIQMDLQISCLTESISSIRSNRNERLGNSMIAQMIAEVEGAPDDSPISKTGLTRQLSRSITFIQQEIEKLQEGYIGGPLYTDTLT